MAGMLISKLALAGLWMGGHGMDMDVKAYLGISRVHNDYLLYLAFAFSNIMGGMAWDLGEKTLLCLLCRAQDRKPQG